MNTTKARKLLARTHGYYRCPQCNLEAFPGDGTVSSDDSGHSVHLDCPKGGTVRFGWFHALPEREQCQDALETVISLTMPRPEGGQAMTAFEAKKVYGQVASCPVEGGDGFGPAISVPVAEYLDALRSVSLLWEALRHALPYCYDPCDQTVACPECGEIWWEQDTDMDGNWHAPGCNLHAARVLVGQSNNDRDPSDPVPTPNPDPRTPAQHLRDKVLEGWFMRLAKMDYAEEPPAGMDKKTWSRAVTEVLDRLRDATDTGLANGPYARVKP